MNNTPKPTHYHKNPKPITKLSLIILKLNFYLSLEFGLNREFTGLNLYRWLQIFDNGYRMAVTKDVIDGVNYVDFTCGH